MLGWLKSKTQILRIKLNNVMRLFWVFIAAVALLCSSAAAAVWSAGRRQVQVSVDRETFAYNVSFAGRPWLVNGGVALRCGGVRYASGSSPPAAPTPSPPSPPACSAQVDTAFSGTPLGNTTAALTEAQCCAACTAFPGCEFWNLNW